MAVWTNALIVCLLLAAPAGAVNLVREASSSKRLRSSSAMFSRLNATRLSYLRELEDECQCTFEAKCTCGASVDFMQCIADACSSGKCDCQGHHAFQSACNDMDDLCPDVNLECTIFDDGVSGSAMCTSPAGQLSASLAPPAPKKKKAAKKEEAAAMDIETPEAPKVEVPGGEFFPVPTTTKCIIIICVQYMIIFTALALVRTYHEFTRTPSGTAEAALRGAGQTMFYGPTLCVLFIACRMRVEFLSEGKDQPQMWVQNCMYATTFAVLTTSILVLLLPLFGTPMVLDKATGEMKKPQGQGPMVMGLTVARYVIQLCMYGGIGGVIVGIFTYLPPGETDLMKLPPPAPAVMCTMILVVVFFSAQLVVALARSYSEHTGKDLTRIVTIMNAVGDTVSFAPMLSILYLAARMRALQHDSQPQTWAQQCMYASTFALNANTVLAIVVPTLLGGRMETDPTTGQQTFHVGHRTVAMVLTAVRYCVLLNMYGGACGVIYSIFAFEAPAGKRTVPVSPTVQCVVNLCIQYFCIFLALNLMNTCKELGLVGGEVLAVADDSHLQITIVKAEGLKHLNYSADYITVTCSAVGPDGKDKAHCETTQKIYQKHGGDPFWNETYTLNWARGQSLHFAVSDRGLLGSRQEGSGAVLDESHFWPNGFVGDVPISGMDHAKLNISILPQVQQKKGGMLSRLFAALEASKATVAFAPMLSILFVTTRMYALLLTDKKGAPQAWAQDGMFMATWALLISFCSLIACSLLMDSVEMDADGNVVSKSSNKMLNIGMTCLRYFSMLLLYGGMITVVVAIFTMTPETANGRGSIPVVSGALDATPMSSPPR
eukprot:TRINITY_DN14020_c0_g2_i1.p1 TRINITY_DN14020_c0_g2~~TRINITY_DN14020_c0_g2_i1.p1  ORF type:complete len:831 (+),score=229.43 TRINITY_DN14020_c0_g2_i1:76-2568(+)